MDATAPVSAPPSPPPATDLDVSALPDFADVLDLLTDHLAAWMPLQRWYAHKGAGAPTVLVAGWAPLRVAPDHVVIELVVEVQLEGGSSALYQVPLVLRHPDAPAPPREDGSEVGVIAVPGGPLRADDACRDTDGRAALVAPLVGGEGALGPGLSLAVHRTDPSAPLPLGRRMRSRLLAGEQSNSSMIVETDGASPLIVKLFRVLQDGENPDVLLQGALSAVGSTRVPAMLGSATLRHGQLRTHALFAQEFLPGVEDAWRVALQLAQTGEDFTGPARELGRTVAEVHHDLAHVLGTAESGAEDVSNMLAQMRERLETVAAEVPQVAEHRAALEALLQDAAEANWPSMQRIHGDLHLGQVLQVPGRGWVLLDFEGEPLRPLTQRNLPDTPLRDVAGMLRSLDYVAGAVALDHGTDATAWAQAAREAFLEGYVTGADPAARQEQTSLLVLLAALEADKAVYEALYESRNRPDWLPIPLGALERISARAAEAGSAD